MSAQESRRLTTPVEGDLRIVRFGMALPAVCPDCGRLFADDGELEHLVLPHHDLALLLERVARRAISCRGSRFGVASRLNQRVGEGFVIRGRVY